MPLIILRRAGADADGGGPYFGAEEATSFWKRGSLRSGSNIGSNRSNAGVSGGFAARGASYGIESSFSKVEMERSGSPMRAATRARMSSGLGPVSASFSIGNHRDRALGQSQCSGVVTKTHVCKREISHAEQNFQAVL